MCILESIEDNVEEAEASLEGAHSFLDISICVETLVRQTTAKFFRCQQASGNISAGASVVLAVRNNAPLGQSLFMVANPLIT
jgi:hypothetical protein